LPELDPGIHVFLPVVADKDVDPRVKPGGDEKLALRQSRQIGR